MQHKKPKPLRREAAQPKQTKKKRSIVVQLRSTHTNEPWKDDPRRYTTPKAAANAVAAFTKQYGSFGMVFRVKPKQQAK